MKVRIVEWYEYVPDCPADLEVSSPSILAVLRVDPIDGSWTDLQEQEAIELYKRCRILDDYLGWATTSVLSGKLYPQPDGTITGHAIEQAGEEALDAQRDFEAHYNGFFSSSEYEVGKIDNAYIINKEVT